MSASSPPALRRSERLLSELQQLQRQLQQQPHSRTVSIEAHNRSLIRSVSSLKAALTEAELEAEHAGSARARALQRSQLQHLQTTATSVQRDIRRRIMALHSHKHQPDAADARQELLRLRVAGRAAGGNQQPGQQGQGQGQQQQQRQAAEITASLGRTRRMMAEQLERVSLVSGTLQEQDSILTRTLEEHVSLGGVVKGAGGALRRLKVSDALDVLTMYASTGLFFLTVLYVVWARVPLFGML